MKTTIASRITLLFLASLFVLASCESTQQSVSSTIIVGATIYDGTGGEGFIGNVRFDGDQITDIGAILPVDGETVIDADGLVLTPGFIDTHAHYFEAEGKFRDMGAVLSQGVTTIATGLDGFAPAAEQLAYIRQAELVTAFTANPSSVNVAFYSPHNSIRHEVMGSDNQRHATAEEIDAMAKLVGDDMRAGAIGLATGLEYEPGIFSSTEEVIALAKVAAEFGGSYASHIRDEDDRVVEAISEALRIGREADIPAHISHIKIADRALWGTTDEVLATLDAARAEGIDVTADIYPYERWASNLGILFPDRDFSNRAAAEFTFEHTATPEDILLSVYAPNPDYEGRTIAEISMVLEQDEITTLLELAQAANEYYRENGQWASLIIVRGMHPDDISNLLQWPFTNICTDGGPFIAHPRSYGSFPRIFRHFVKELGLLTMPEAVHKMTGLSAASLGVENRGVLKPGMMADLVLFDPSTIADRATMDDPKVESVGIHKVWVNGVLSFDDGKLTRRYAGRIVTHARPQSTGTDG